MLEVKLLHPDAKLPTVATSGEDLGYDLYALEDTYLRYGEVTQVRTGIAVAAYQRNIVRVRGGFEYRSAIGDYIGPEKIPLGLLIEDRSSMASKGITKSAGVIDAGYRGEIKVLLTLWGVGDTLGVIGHRRGYQIKAGDKIAQMRPTQVLTGEVREVTTLQDSQRGHKGFGSSGS